MLCFFFGDRWCHGEWPSTWKGKNIAILEFYPIVLSPYLWGACMKNQCILFYTDNEALVHVINKNTCKVKDLMVFFVRKLVLICLEHNIYFCAKHVPNMYQASLVSCQTLSHFQVLKFKRLNSTASSTISKSNIPLNLQPQNMQV